MQPTVNENLQRDDFKEKIRLGERACLTLKYEPNRIMYINENGFIDFCSHEFARAVGIENSHAAINKHFNDVYKLFEGGDELIAGAKKAFEEIRWTGATQEKQLELKFPKDDKKHHYIVQSVPIINEHKKFLGAKVLFLDATALSSYIANENARFLLDKAPIGCTLRDQNNRIIDCNAEIERMFGAASKAELLRRFKEFHPEYQPDGALSSEKIKTALRECDDKGRSQIEWLYIDAKGDPLPTKLVVVRADWRSERGYVIYCIDLREIKKKEENERLANERVRAMLDATPIACVFFDDGVTAIDCNLEAMRLFETNSKEDMLKHFFHYSPAFQPNGEPTEEIRRKNIVVALEEGYHVFELMEATASGKELPVLITLKSMDWNGVRCLAAYIQDLREIVTKDKNVKEAEEIPLALLDATPIAAFLWDDELNLIDCNTKAVSMFGFNRKSELIDNFSELLQNQRSKTAMEDKDEMLSKAFQDGYGKFDWELTTKMGEALPTEAIFARVPWHDGYRVAAYLRDLRKSRK
ncbi:MAG: PAS domain-containing protein [Helicobacteraceae bacterium]|jgi:PAS domain S-box-containing protein|nr:PAS domain-containing protein [Helicobacteraceae bacterium]